MVVLQVEMSKRHSLFTLDLVMPWHLPAVGSEFLLGSAQQTQVVHFPPFQIRWKLFLTLRLLLYPWFLSHHWLLETLDKLHALLEAVKRVW